MGLLSVISRVGAALAPFVVQLTRINAILPFALMGGLTFLAALACWFLPETRGKPTLEVIGDDDPHILEEVVLEAPFEEKPLANGTAAPDAEQEGDSVLAGDKINPGFVADGEACKEKPENARLPGDEIGNKNEKPVGEDKEKESGDESKDDIEQVGKKDEGPGTDAEETAVEDNEKKLIKEEENLGFEKENDTLEKSKESDKEEDTAL